jgi:hypothetical protein
MQYAQVFNHLCQYAGYHADTDARKLKEWLNLVKADAFNELINMAITQEDCISAHRAEKEMEDTHGTLNGATTKVSVGPEHCYPSPISKQYTRQIGSQVTPAGPIQSAIDTTTRAATAASPTAELSAIQPGKQ